MEFSPEISYHGIQIPQTEKEWLEQIYHAMTSQTLTSDTIKLAMELAWKRGYSMGAR